MEDEQIVTLYWNRDETAIQETQTKYDRYLTKIACNILADMEDSRESVNDTYLAAWNSMPPQRPSVLSAYLAKLTRRISIDRFRYRTRDKRRDSQYALSLSELDQTSLHTFLWKNHSCPGESGQSHTSSAPAKNRFPSADASALPSSTNIHSQLRP